MPSVRLTYNTVLSLAVMRKQTLPRSMVVVAVPPAPALSINVVEVVARERVFPKVRPLLMVEDAWERKPPAKREFANVEVASIVSVWRRRTWRPPNTEVEVPVPVIVSVFPKVKAALTVEDAWERKPPAKREFAAVEVASIVSVWRRRTWRPPNTEVEVPVPVIVSVFPKVKAVLTVEDAWERRPPAKREFAAVEVASIVSVWRRRTWRPP